MSKMFLYTINYLGYIIKETNDKILYHIFYIAIIIHSILIVIYSVIVFIIANVR